MKVVLAAWGTRGDVQPSICLGRALADRGHEVKVLAPPGGEAITRAADLSYGALPLDWQQVLRAEPAQRMLAAGRIGAVIRWINEQEKACADELHQALIEGVGSADVVVSTMLLSGSCRAIAEASNVPILPIHLTPLIPSRSFMSPWLSHQRDLGPLNRLSFELPALIWWRGLRRDLARLHGKLGLAPPTLSSWKGDFWWAPCMLAYSQALFPMPHDWPSKAHPVGAIQPWPELRAALGEAGVPRELDSWLEDGPPPVFLSFGSMPVLDKEATVHAIRTTLRDLGVRGIVAAGWSDLDALGDDGLFFVDEVDHQSLLPRCAAAVHHGGAGTTAASLGAGIPTLICSVWGDQPFWGRRCRELAVGDTFPFSKFSARRLAEGLRNLLRPEVAARAKALARRMEDEDGVANAVAHIEKALVEGRRSPLAA